MLNVRTIAVCVAAAGLWAAAASAQTSTTSTSTSSNTSSTATTGQRKPGEINRRLTRQANRIQAGVKDGQLTQTQASQLTATDAKVQAEAQSDRTANNGKLTQDERKQLNTELNQNSQQIRQERRAARRAQRQASQSQSK